MRNTSMVQTPRAANPVIDAPTQRPALPSQMNADSFLSAVKKRWRLVLTTAIVVAILAAILASLQTKQYRASAIAGVTAIGGNMGAGDLYRGVEVLQQRTIVATVAALASVDETKREAFAPFPGAAGHYSIGASVLPNTNLLRIDVEGADPVLAAKIANRVPAILAAQTQAMYKLYGVSTVSEATRPVASVSPRIARAAVAGAIIGLVLGAAAAFAKSLRPRGAARLTDAVPAT
jgi:capsular polysaccharide biosynthesis protein